LAGKEIGAVIICKRQGIRKDRNKEESAIMKKSTSLEKLAHNGLASKKILSFVCSPNRQIHRFGERSTRFYAFTS